MHDQELDLTLVYGERSLALHVDAPPFSLPAADEIPPSIHPHPDLQPHQQRQPGEQQEEGGVEEMGGKGERGQEDEQQVRCPCGCNEVGRSAHNGDINILI